jgi:hypothetical protein
MTGNADTDANGVTAFTPAIGVGWQAEREASRVGSHRGRGHLTTTSGQVWSPTRPSQLEEPERIHVPNVGHRRSSAPRPAPEHRPGRRRPRCRTPSRPPHRPRTRHPLQPVGHLLPFDPAELQTRLDDHPVPPRWQPWPPLTHPPPATDRSPAAAHQSLRASANRQRLFAARPRSPIEPVHVGLHPEAWAVEGLPVPDRQGRRRPTIGRLVSDAVQREVQRRVQRWTPAPVAAHSDVQRSTETTASPGCRRRRTLAGGSASWPWPPRCPASRPQVATRPAVMARRQADEPPPPEPTGRAPPRARPVGRYRTALVSHPAWRSMATRLLPHSCPMSTPIVPAHRRPGATDSAGV